MDVITHEGTEEVSPAVQTCSPTPREMASHARGTARNVLSGHSGGLSHRLILTLSVMTVLTVSIALYAATACLVTAGYLVWDDALWIDATANTLLAVFGLVLVMPLAVSLSRLASLMTAPDGEVIRGMAVSVPTPSLIQLFYPFTSLRAYGRTMAVGMEGLAFLLGGLGLPILAGRLAWLSMLTAGWADWLRILVIIGIVILGLGWAFGVLLLSGTRLGFGYLVFVHDELPLGDVNRYYRTLRRPLFAALRLRVCLLGLYALSAVAICIPFVFHSIPLGLCCGAAYGRVLTED